MCACAQRRNAEEDRQTSAVDFKQKPAAVIEDAFNYQFTATSFQVQQLLLISLFLSRTYTEQDIRRPTDECPVSAVHFCDPFREEERERRGGGGRSEGMKYLPTIS